MVVSKGNSFPVTPTFFHDLDKAAKGSFVVILIIDINYQTTHYVSS